LRRLKAFVAVILLSLLIAVSVIAVYQLTSQPSSKAYGVKVAFPNLSFDHPVGVYSPKDQTNRLFVVGQMGLIYVFENQEKATETNIFLDIRSHVHLGAFLGLAFNSNYSNNGYFYVNYLADNPLRTIISQWSTLPTNPDKADPNSEKILLQIPQLYDSHSGGQLAFGKDGYLYIALGDGGPYGDILNNAQNRSSMLGKILRIDVNNSSKDRNYIIPADNPFVGNNAGYREEIYAYGFRNPWRFSFDSTGKLWAGDVGQDRMEEIDVVQNGKNYGWNIMEGTLPYVGGNQTRLEPPIWVYGRNQGNATIGGFVYSGFKNPGLVNSYVYGDYVSGRIWALSGIYSNNLKNREIVQTSLHLTSFGVDDNNEIYICADDGRIYSLYVAG
jgi:glucose/arabinose dehydrogenase